MSTLAEKLIGKLKENNLMMACAESCTGGMIAVAMTDIAGSSDVFDRGFVTYSNQAKMEMLGVRAQTLKTCGAVSSETAGEMAAGALKNSTANVAVSCTGIAGPAGDKSCGTEKKPVGLVYIGLAVGEHEPQSFEYHFAGDRHAIRMQTVETALRHLLDAV